MVRTLMPGIVNDGLLGHDSEEPGPKTSHLVSHPPQHPDFPRDPHGRNFSATESQFTGNPEAGLLATCHLPALFPSSLSQPVGFFSLLRSKPKLKHLSGSVTFSVEGHPTTVQKIRQTPHVYPSAGPYQKEFRLPRCDGLSFGDFPSPAGGGVIKRRVESSSWWPASLEWKCQPLF